MRTICGRNHAYRPKSGHFASLVGPEVTQDSMSKHAERIKFARAFEDDSYLQEKRSSQTNKVKQMLKNNVYLKHKLNRHRPMRTLKAT